MVLKETNCQSAQSNILVKVYKTMPSVQSSILKAKNTRVTLNLIVTMSRKMMQMQIMKKMMMMTMMQTLVVPIMSIPIVSIAPLTIVTVQTTSTKQV